jgi:hypothetical protein
MTKVVPENEIATSIPSPRQKAGQLGRRQGSESEIKMNSRAKL